MKKLYPALAFLLISIACSAQTVDNVQRTLVTNKTATWCEYCGEWGLPLWDDIMTDNDNDKALPLALHESSSSALYSTAASDFYKQWQSSDATPRFYVNEQDANVVSSGGGTYPTYTRTHIKKMVDSLYQIAPVANVGFNFSVSGNNLTVNTKSKFFVDASGEYYVNVYLVYRNQTVSQKVHNKGYVSTKEHEVLKYSATGDNNFGVPLANGSITQGTEQLQNFTYALQTPWKAGDITIVALLWKKNGSKYGFVNGSRKDMGVNTGIEDIADNSTTIAVYPTPSTGTVFLKLDETLLQQPVSVAIYDVTGRIVSEKNYINADKTNGTIQLDRSSFGGQAGVYLVNVQTGDIRKTARVIIE